MAGTWGNKDPHLPLSLSSVFSGDSLHDVNVSSFPFKRAFLVAQLVKNSPAMQETPVKLQSGRSTGEGIGYPLQYSWVSLVAQSVKNLLAVGETWVRSLGWEDPLEKGKGTHSSILAWKIPWTAKSQT